MPLIRPGIRRLFNLALRREGTRPSEIDEEIALHLELRVQQLRLTGLSPEDARAEATRRFGSTDAARERLRIAAKRRDRKMDVREQLASLAQDVRYAARGVVREPWFTAFVAITLGLGIGVNAAMYGVVVRLLLRGPEYVRDMDRLQNLYLTTQRPGMDARTNNSFGYVTYTTLLDNARTMKVATFKQTKNGTLYQNGEKAEQWNSAEATPDLFPLLGATPLLGRFFTAEEDRPSPSQLVVVLGYTVWQREFNGDEKIVGKSITLTDKSYIVIGVARKGFTGPELAPVDVWMPSVVRGSNGSANWTTSWNWSGLHVIARLQPGVTPAQAATEATTIYQAANRDRNDMRNSTLSLAPISFTRSGTEPPETRISRWLIGVCVIVLIVACSNVANLLLARAVRRRREVAVRLALGVSRARLLRLFLVESLLLSGVGAIAGLAVAFATGTFMRRTLLPDIDWSSSVLDSRVLLVSLCVAVFVGVATGLIPAWRASRPDLTAALKSGVRDGGGHQSRARSTLTVLQAALSVVLLVGAGLFVRSLSNVRSIDLGIQTNKVLVTQDRKFNRARSSIRQPIRLAMPCEHRRRGRFQFGRLLFEIGTRPTPVFRRIARQLHAIDRKHLAPDQSWRVADGQHSGKDLRDVVVQRAHELRDGGAVRRGIAAQRDERHVVLARSLDTATADNALRVREQHHLLGFLHRAAGRDRPNCDLIHQSANAMRISAGSPRSAPPSAAEEHQRGHRRVGTQNNNVSSKPGAVHSLFRTFTKRKIQACGKLSSTI